MPKAADRLRDLCLEIIKAVSASPLVERYNIGFTSQPLITRGNQYRGIGYDCLVLMADKLTRVEALNLEEALWKAIAAHDRRTPTFKKCQQSHQESRYRKSYGGSSTELKNLRVHGVYIAWWHRPAITAPPRSH